MTITKDDALIFPVLNSAKLQLLFIFSILSIQDKRQSLQSLKVTRLQAVPYISTTIK